MSVVQLLLLEYLPVPQTTIITLVGMIMIIMMNTMEMIPTFLLLVLMQPNHHHPHLQTIHSITTVVVEKRSLVMVLVLMESTPSPISLLVIWRDTVATNDSPSSVRMNTVVTARQTT